MSLSCQFMERESSLDTQPVFPEPPTRQDGLIQGDAPSSHAGLPGASIMVERQDNNK